LSKAYEMESHAATMTLQRRYMTDTEN